MTSNAVMNLFWHNPRVTIKYPGILAPACTWIMPHDSIALSKMEESQLQITLHKLKEYSVHEERCVRLLPKEYQKEAFDYLQHHLDHKMHEFREALEEHRKKRQRAKR